MVETPEKLALSTSGNIKSGFRLQSVIGQKSSEKRFSYCDAFIRPFMQISPSRVCSDSSRTCKKEPGGTALHRAVSTRLGLGWERGREQPQLRVVLWVGVGIIAELYAKSLGKSNSEQIMYKTW